MTHNFPTQFVEKPLSLSELDLGEAANTAVSRLAQAELGAYFGFSPDMAPTLEKHAKEPGILEYCPNDLARFGSIVLAQSWMNKGRGFIGIGKTWDRPLLYDWVGPEKTPKIKSAPYTTAFRTGEEGLSYARYIRQQTGMSDFRLGYLGGLIIIGLATQYFGLERTQISLETWKSNQKANTLYRDLGFILVEESDPEFRATLKPIGDTVDEHVIMPGCQKLQPHRVEDVRLHYVLGE